MMPRRSPIPVRAAHDLSQRSSPPVKAGTPGEIIDMSENGLYSYTVTFHTVAAIGGATDGERHAARPVPGGSPRSLIGGPAAGAYCSRTEHLPRMLTACLWSPVTRLTGHGPGHAGPTPAGGSPDDWSMLPSMLTRRAGARAPAAGRQHAVDQTHRDVTLRIGSQDGADTIPGE